MWESGATETTAIGFVNRNNQAVCGHRGVEGTDHEQRAYKLKCQNDDCGFKYGVNGTDIFQRKCPKCQGGRPGIEY